MTPKISRRTFMLSAGGIGMAGLFAGLLKFAQKESDVRSYVQAIIYRNIPDITFDGADLDQFVEDIAQDNSSSFLSYNWFKSLVGRSINSDFLTSIQNPMVRRLVAGYEYPVMTAFFMATDFFPEGYRKGRRISFIHSADPYLAKCGNPIARFDDLYAALPSVPDKIVKIKH